MEGIKIHKIETNQFKTNLYAVFLATPLSRENVTKDALIAAVLRRGTMSIPSQDKISKELEEDVYKRQIITMALLISLIVTVMEILNGFLETDKEKIKMAQTFNANKFQTLTKIIIPANIPTFFNSLKVNIGLSLVGVITGEFLVSKAGLGYLIVYGGQVFQLDLVMTGVIILAIVAAIMYQAVVITERIIVKRS